MSSSEATVIEVIRQLFESKERAAPELTAQTPLNSSIGLDSLDFAEMVTRLEEATGKDPFAVGMVPEVRTIADLAALYD